ncbi:MAG: hypothetical protein Q7T18_00890 [Sedimentisphaerales bacterium]|nr:hypothetical protein [Sedimentisphaerales bacterium]
MIKDITLIIGAALAIAIFVMPRRYFLLPYIVAACLIPADQRIIMIDLDFTPLRMLIAAGVLRMFLRGEVVSIRWNTFDKTIFFWLICRCVVYVLLWADMKAVTNRSGVLFDAFGLYWLFRQNIRSWDDVRQAILLFALAAIVSAPLVAIEWVTGHNPFSALGRVTTALRGGRYRCQGAFPHSIMLGLFWATLTPIFIGLASADKRKYLYWAAAIATGFIVIATASSTPIAILIEILLLLALFSYRHYGKLIVGGLCLLLVMLHMVMESPVWHLIARVNIVGGSTGWHRFHLIDQAIKHFDEWALWGTKGTGHWGYGLEDVTNQYILEGVRGGFISLVLLVIVLVMAVRTFGAYSLRPMPRKWQWFVWCLCVAMLGHCLSFIGVSYFGQIQMLLYLMFAIAALAYELSTPKAATAVVSVGTNGKHNGYINNYR